MDRLANATGSEKPGRLIGSTIEQLTSAGNVIAIAEHLILAVIDTVQQWLQFQERGC
jgi:hypothetical protein